MTALSRMQTLVVAASALIAGASFFTALKARSAETVSKSAALGPVTNKQLKSLQALDQKYQSAKSVNMKVEKTLKLGLLEQERKTAGSLWLSNGRLRMELDGAEKTLLVVNKKNLWAVTFPPPEFKDAAIQVIKGETGSKKSGSRDLVSLLSMGGILKFFKPTAAQTSPNGETLFFLSPKKAHSEFKRAQIQTSSDGKTITELRYWDDRDNETRLQFSEVAFDKKADEKLFTFVPPANADVMAL